LAQQSIDLRAFEKIKKSSSALAAALHYGHNCCYCKSINVKKAKLSVFKIVYFALWSDGHERLHDDRSLASVSDIFVLVLGMERAHWVM